MRYLWLPFVLLFIFTGCGRIPEPVGYDYSTQHKMQASHHWDILAADIAYEINNELIRSDYLNTPVFVKETCGNENVPCEPLQTTVFNETFRDLLITHLVNLGVPTSSISSDSAIVIHYKAQTVYHHKNRIRTIRPGLITALTAGILVLRNAPGEIVALVTAGAIDFANSNFVSISNFEVVITTSMIAKNNYMYRNSNIYYINDLDSWHYQINAKTSEIKLTAGIVPPVTHTPITIPKIEQPEPLFPSTTSENPKDI